jgi:hypothetical protein
MNLVNGVENPKGKDVKSTNSTGGDAPNSIVKQGGDSDANGQNGDSDGSNPNPNSISIANPIGMPQIPVSAGKKAVKGGKISTEPEFL